MKSYCAQCSTTYDQSSGECPKCGGQLRLADDDFMGRELDGKYFVSGRLGIGGMGTVYRARQRSMDRDVAIKVLRADRSADERAVQRFKREVRAASQLNHPNTITVYDFGRSEEGSLYIVMEMVEGNPLSRLVSTREPFSLERAVGIVTQVCDALAEAHAKGIVHRDLKCSNIMLLDLPGNPDSVKVLDFGTAKLFTANHEAALTEQGQIVGTVAYMSPEQVQGLPVDPRADIYAMGVVLFELLCGTPPFGRKDVVEILTRHVKDPVPLLADVNPEIEFPPEVDRLLRRAMAKDPRERPDSVRDFKAELQDLLLQVQSAAERTIQAQRPPRLDHTEPEAVAPLPPQERTERTERLAHALGTSQERTERTERLSHAAPSSAAPSSAAPSDQAPSNQALSKQERTEREAAAGLPAQERTETGVEKPAPEQTVVDRRPSGELPRVPEVTHPTVELQVGRERTARAELPRPVEAAALPRRRAATGLLLGAGVLGLVVLVVGLWPQGEPASERLALNTSDAGAAPAVEAVAGGADAGLALAVEAQARGGDASRPRVDAASARVADAAPPARARTDAASRVSSRANDDSAGRVRLVVDTAPSGAEVLLRGMAICRTPCDRDLPAGMGWVRIGFRLSGHRRASRNVDLSGPDARLDTVRLRRVTRAAEALPRGARVDAGVQRRRPTRTLLPLDDGEEGGE